MAQLSTFDREMIKAAQKARALLAIKSHLIEKSETILVGCSDGDQADDMWRHHCKVCASNRHHAFLDNGLPLFISEYCDAPGAKSRRENLLESIALAAEMKKMHRLVINPHAPCGIAYGNHFDILEVWRLAIEGKLLLKSKQEFSKLAISCYCHIDHNGGDNDREKETRYIDRKVMTDFLADYGRPVRC